MIKPRALDLFCGAGGAAMGLHRAGFDVVGVDLFIQKNFPFPFIRADATQVDFRGFDFIWASPPCQAYSKAQKIRKKTHPELIPLIRDKLKKSGVKYVIENVEGAPLENPILLCGKSFPGLQTYRHRLFECNFKVTQPPHPEHNIPTTKMGRRPKPDEFMHVVGNFSGIHQARKAMGINWMTRDELREAIPPQFSEYIASFTLGKGENGNDR